jgi:ubiquinone/menaquinone biosynthesis C-methylase UbiE
MRKFHTYVTTERGLHRGVHELAENLKPANVQQAIKQKIAQQGSCAALEIGTGKGNVLIELAKKYSKATFVGVNRYKNHGPTARQWREVTGNCHDQISRRVKIIALDARKLPFKDKSFDLVISQVSFMHITDKLKALEEVYRVLKVGGEAHLQVDDWYCKKHKPEGEMPAIYMMLLQMFGTESTPRIILRKGDVYISLRDFLKRYPELRVHVNDVNKEQWLRPSFSTVIIMRRKSETPLRFKAKRNTRLSREYTQLPITNHNPASFGVVDVYDITP